jgi:hypothetical protein
MGYDDTLTGIFIGYFFEDWTAIDQSLTGKEHTDDSGPLEDYAKAIDVRMHILGDGVLFYINILGEPLDSLATQSCSTFFPIDFFSSQQVREKLDNIKRKLTATGFKPNNPPIIVDVNEFLG